MIASSNVDLSIMAKNYEFFEEEKANLNLRRNFLFLFDNLKNEIMKLDVTIGVSLLDRKENQVLESKLDKIHPLIPNAKMTGPGPLNLQQFKEKEPEKPDPRI